jgi:hypothetical protein
MSIIRRLARGAGVTQLAEYQAPLLAQLAAIVAEIDAHLAAIHALEHERKRIEYRLRNSGWRPEGSA